MMSQMEQLQEHTPTSDMSINRDAEKDDLREENARLREENAKLHEQIRMLSLRVTLLEEEMTLRQQQETREENEELGLHDSVDSGEAIFCSCNGHSTCKTIKCECKSIRRFCGKSCRCVDVRCQNRID